MTARSLRPLLEGRASAASDYRSFVSSGLSNFRMVVQVKNDTHRPQAGLGSLCRTLVSSPLKTIPLMAGDVSHGCRLSAARHTSTFAAIMRVRTHPRLLPTQLTPTDTSRCSSTWWQIRAFFLYRRFQFPYPSSAPFDPRRTDDRQCIRWPYYLALFPSWSAMTCRRWNLSTATAGL